jgi:hypothetical protein
MLKSIGAVIGAYALSIVLVLATDPLLSFLFAGDYVKGKVPANTALITSTALFVLISILCAWVCARLAPNRPSRHVLWFFALGEVLGIITTIPNWSSGYPHWYWLSWLLTWPISCWIGLRLSARVAAKTSAAAA